MTTVSTGNVTGTVSVYNGSKLTLGADMLLSGQFNLYSTGSTLDMGGDKLSASSIYLGWSGGVPTLANRGPLLASNLYVANQPFSLSPSDSAANLYLSNVGLGSLGGHSVSTLSLSNTSALTTTLTGSVTGNASIYSGSKLTLGADMTLSGNFDLEDSGSTLDMGGHKLSANYIYLGWNDGVAVNVANVGPLNATNYLYVYGTAINPPALNAGNLYVEYGSTLNPAALNAGNLYVEYGSTLNLPTSGTASSLTLAYSSALTTVSTGNVTGTVSVYNGSKLTLGADMLLSGQFNLYSTGSTLDMGGDKLSASSIYLGWSGGVPTLANRGPLLASNLYVANQPFSLSPSDSAANLYLSNVGLGSLGGHSVSTLSLSNTSALTTTLTGSVTGNASIYSGSKLTLGADMTLSGNFDLEDSGSTLDMGGHKLSANYIYLGWNDGVAVNVANVGPLNATNYLYVYGTAINPPALNAGNLYVEYGSTLNLPTSGTASSLTLAYSSALTTVSTGNVTGTVSVYNGSKLTLGADMLLSGQFNLYSTGSTLDMGGHKLSASSIYLGWSGGFVNIANPGPVSTPYLYVGNGSAAPLLAAGSTVNTQMTISGNSHLTLLQPAGQLTGMTFLGSSSGALSINDTSVLRLSGGSNSAPTWLFRWKDQGSGTWVNTLTGSIAAGHVSVSSTSGYSVFDDEGYTYVATPTTLIWNGGGGDNNWNTSGNWGGTIPAAGQWLRFGALAAGGHAANDNNLAANSLFYGIFFDKLAPSYNLQGNAIQLSGDVLNQSGSNQTIGLNIQLVPGNGAFDTNAINFDSGGMKITDSGSISGAGMELVKTGSGTLILSGSNNYNGGTEVLAGKLIATSPNAILDGTNLIVGTRAATVFAAPVADAPIASAAPAPTPVPEAGTLALLAAGGCAAAALVRRRRFPPESATRLSRRFVCSAGVKHHRRG